MSAKIKNITLELSGKAFTDDTQFTMYNVCRKMFTQWKQLTERADIVSVLLFVADGSEILEYTGDLSQDFEWSYWMGCANHAPRTEGVPERLRRNTHDFPVKYMEDAAPRPYAWLKRLIEVLKETGGEITGKPIRVGAMYDNGPEFAISDFKFNRHREIAEAHTLYPNSFVTCTSRLHEDPKAYAGFPEGVPEGTSIGTFLGRQYKVYSRDLGFDYLWLSNGMGFGTETWGIVGMLFDKKSFYPEKCESAARKMLDFWDDFLREYPDVVLETRGSNYSAGVEIGSDGCPLDVIYRKYKVAPPVNSPWAALLYNPGLEISAWMSHIAEMPGDHFPFRFYIHDPWFMNSPWLDRYGRAPWDLFGPLSVSRITGAGEVQSANRISLLTVDDSWGRMPDQVPREVIPLFDEALNHAPDAPGPLVWVYPFDEYNALVRGDAPRPDIPLIEDFYLGETLQEGVPLNTVISTGNFKELLASGNSMLDHSILVIPVSACAGENWKYVKQCLDKGIRAIFYGSLNSAPQEIAELFHLRAGEPLTGEAKVRCSMAEDEYADHSIAERIIIHPQYTNGGLTEICDVPDHVLAAVSFGTEERAVVVKRVLENGTVTGFVRTLLPSGDVNTDSPRFDYSPKNEICPTATLMRYLLAEFGWKFSNRMWESTFPVPQVTISRNDNAFYFNIFAYDTTAEMRVNTPYGAPILQEMETRIDENGDAVWHPDRSWHKECRCFVKQKQSGVIRAMDFHQEYPYYSEHGKRYYGPFKDAEVRFFVSRKGSGEIEVANPDRYYTSTPLLAAPQLPYTWEKTSDGECIVVKNVTGYLCFARVERYATEEK
ncbi:MAG: hypothetical protein IJZ19_01765 [Lentisphaeria bacterium]|nr:hypothetical protein [Lentisphaeria bacterium]